MISTTPATVRIPSTEPAIPTGQVPPQNQKKPGLLPALRNPLFLALLLLLAINEALLKLQPLADVDPEALPAAHTWVWWAAREYLAAKPPPNVVLLGSSLLMHPISRTDADYLNKDLDYVHHHRSLCLDDQLASRGAALRSVRSFNFSLPGGMVSDDYIIARALFTGARKPEVVVLGLSLRDFIDNGVRCAGATPAFRYLKRYTNVDDLVSISMPQIWQKLDYWCGKYIYLWGRKLDLQVWMSQQARRLLGPVMGRISSTSKLNDLDLERNLPSNLRAEVEEGMFIVARNQPYSYEDNSAEYIKRYRTPNPGLFAIQAEFLDKMLVLCQQKKIKVLVLNMPLTPKNLTLMPAGSYQQYLRTLQQESYRHKCRFVNLQDSGEFIRSDFYDTSHMNGTGGKKLIAAIVDNFPK